MADPSPTPPPAPAEPVQPPAVAPKVTVKQKLRSGVSALKALWHIDHVYAENSKAQPVVFQYALIFQDPNIDPKLLPAGAAVRRYVVARLRRAGLHVAEETLEAPDSPTLHFVKVSGPPNLLAAHAAADRLRTASTTRANKSVEVVKAKKWEEVLGGHYPGSGPDVALTESEQQQIVRKILQSIEIDEDGRSIGMEVGLAAQRLYDKPVPRQMLAWAKEFKYLTEQLPLHNYEVKKSLFTRWVFGRGKYTSGSAAGSGTHAAGGSSKKPAPPEEERWKDKTLLETAKAVIDYCTFGLLTTPPLGEIRDYYGEKVAFYFAWLHFYTVWLVVPTILGALLTFLTSTKDSMKWSFFYCSFLMVWGTVFTEGWKRRQAELAYLWGTFQDEDAGRIESEITHPEGDGVPSASIGLLSPDPGRHGARRGSVSSAAGGSGRGGREENLQDLMERASDFQNRKLMRRLASWALLGTLLMLSMLSFVFCLWFEDVVGKDSWLVRLPAITYVVALTLFRNLYVHFVEVTNRWELHSSRDDADNQMIMKLFTFDFVAWFLGPMYIAFVRKDLDSLEYLVSTTLISKQVIQNVMENVLPLSSVMMKGAAAATAHAAEAAAGKKLDTTIPSPDALAKDAAQESQVLVQYRMDVYDDTIADYLEMAVQFGHVVLFAPAFPLSAACALVNNVIELRTDAFKLLTGHRRPEAHRVDGIGSWLWVLEIMGTVAVISNVGLIFMFFHPSAWDAAKPAAAACAGVACLISVGRLFQAVVVEHVLLAVKLGIAWAVPDVPLWVRFSSALCREPKAASVSE